MIKAVANLPNGRKALIVGLSRENTRRLLRGMPITFRAEDLGLPAMDVIVVAGATENDIIEDLRSIGAPLPPTGKG